ncbi:Dyp-type peroxidase [Actinomyces viscosus]|uniref:Probable deferrochelatase/peroxidase YfeX n=1 Tax=Actinomyces viscosus TaxID=1656 RepID=A0A3S5EWC0_ACTVI|nr:Dyp-type peroxidase [Actinomyces viscosus]TFH53859.1 Dyp-type peroxidase [Actinomyces viscosus]VEI15008.1 Probable deferrochelatase/peroxidase YfeX [Actinomyces viscosus]
MRDVIPQDLSQEILAPPAKASIFLTVTVRDGGEAQVIDLLTDVSGLSRAVGFRYPETMLSCVVGIGAGMWDRLFDVPRPEFLHDFVALQGGKHHAPSTPGDLFFHLRASTLDMCFELARQIMRRLGSVAAGYDEVHAFRYFDERDPLGFVDGTESPRGQAAVVAALVDDGAWTGGSYIIEQKYIHDLTAWDSMSVEEQERVIGRTKLDDIQLPDDEQPTNSHVTMNTIEDADGNELQIVRDNLAFGEASGDQGTFFISYAADPRVTELMLRRMFLGEPEGNYDRILDFSTPLTGCLFFAPPAAFLDEADQHARAAARPQPGPEDPTQPATELSAARGLGLNGPSEVPGDWRTEDRNSDMSVSSEPSDGSLGIGNLKGEV